MRSFSWELIRTIIRVITVTCAESPQCCRPQCEDSQPCWSLTPRLTHLQPRSHHPPHPLHLLRPHLPPIQPQCPGEGGRWCLLEIRIKGDISAAHIMSPTNLALSAGLVAATITAVFQLTGAARSAMTLIWSSEGLWACHYLPSSYCPSQSPLILFSDYLICKYFTPLNWRKLRW